MRSICCVTAWLTLAVSGLAAQTDSMHRSVIETSGVGEVTGSPDYAVVLFSVLSRDGSAARASQRNAAKARALIDTLRAHGISPDSVPTSGFSVQPEYQNGRQTLNSYLARATVRLTMHDLGKIGAVIDAALAAGVDQVPSITFATTQGDALRREAVAAAVKDARLQAESAAGAAGGRVGRLIRLAVSQATPRPYAAATQLSEIRTNVPSPITPPGVTTSAYVTAQWEFVEGH